MVITHNQTPPLHSYSGGVQHYYLRNDLLLVRVWSRQQEIFSCAFLVEAPQLLNYLGPCLALLHFMVWGVDLPNQLQCTLALLRLRNMELIRRHEHFLG